MPRERNYSEICTTIYSDAIIRLQIIRLQIIRLLISLCMLIDKLKCRLSCYIYSKDLRYSSGSHSHNSRSCGDRGRNLYTKTFSILTNVSVVIFDLIMLYAVMATLWVSSNKSKKTELLINCCFSINLTIFYIRMLITVLYSPKKLNSVVWLSELRMKWSIQSVRYQGNCLLFPVYFQVKHLTSWALAVIQMMTLWITTVNSSLRLSTYVMLETYI